MRKTVVTWILTLALVCVCSFSMAEAITEDRAGNPITVPEKVERIISLAPSITQVLVDLGKADLIVAVDSYTMGNGLVSDTLPAFSMMEPDVEQIIALTPDLVLVTGMSLADGADPFSPLTEAGICVAYIPSSNSIEAILEDTLFIGKLVGNEAGAQELNDTLTTAIETYRVETDAPVSVYFEIGPAPSLYSFGSGTFLNEMIELLGGKNIFADQDSWISPSEESILAADPEIIFTNAEWAGDPVAEILSREGWENVSAVQNGRVYLIHENTSSQPNHMIVVALEEMAEAMKK